MKMLTFSPDRHRVLSRNVLFYELVLFNVHLTRLHVWKSVPPHTHQTLALQVMNHLLELNSFLTWKAVRQQRCRNTGPECTAFPSANELPQAWGTPLHLYLSHRGVWGCVCGRMRGVWDRTLNKYTLSKQSVFHTLIRSFYLLDFFSYILILSNMI